MSIVEKIERLLQSGVLRRALVFVPEIGASQHGLYQIESLIGRSLTGAHKALLDRWDGLNLEVVRFHGVSPTTGELRSLKELNTHPIDDAPAGLVFAEDPSGYIYIERGDGSIVSFDTRSGKFSVCADGLDDFVCEFLFGVRGGDFVGEDWLNELRKGGLIA